MATIKVRKVVTSGGDRGRGTGGEPQAASEVLGGWAHWCMLSFLISLTHWSLAGISIPSLLHSACPQLLVSVPETGWPLVILLIPGLVTRAWQVLCPC